MVGSTSNTTELAVATVALARTGRKSKESRNSYFVPFGELYEGIFSYG